MVGKTSWYVVRGRGISLAVWHRDDGHQWGVGAAAADVAGRGRETGKGAAGRASVPTRCSPARHQSS